MNHIVLAPRQEHKFIVVPVSVLSANVIPEITYRKANTKPMWWIRVYYEVLCVGSNYRKGKVGRFNPVPTREGIVH